MGLAEPVDNVIKRGSGTKFLLGSFKSPGTSVTFVRDLQVENGLDKILLLLTLSEPHLTEVWLHVHQPWSRCLETWCTET